jgi:regulator of sigma E protease
LGIILAILIFGFIVFFHELGHFTLAKLNGIEVTEFALGMGPKLISKTYKGTQYSLRLLPIGGFCAMGEDAEATGATDNFHSKSVWQRISVIACGPVFNFILAFVCALILIGNIGYDKPVISEVTKGSAAATSGLEKGDVITKLNKTHIDVFREITLFNMMHSGEDVDVTYLRDGKTHTVNLTPRYDKEAGRYLIGITGGAYSKPTVLSTIKYSCIEIKYQIKTVIDSLKMLVTGKVSPKNLSGPIGITQAVSTSYNESKAYGIKMVVMQMLSIAILISANLGVMNLLPLPALDGGRLVFLFIEVFRKKKIPAEKEGYVHFIGFALLMVLMVFVMYNDIVRIFK